MWWRSDTEFGNISWVAGNVWTRSPDADGNTWYNMGPHTFSPAPVEADEYRGELQYHSGSEVILMVPCIALGASCSVSGGIKLGLVWLRSVMSNDQVYFVHGDFHSDGNAETVIPRVNNAAATDPQRMVPCYL